MTDRLCRRCRLPITGNYNRLYHPACRNRSRAQKAQTATLHAQLLAKQHPGLLSLLRLSKMDLAVLAASALKFLPPQARLAVFRRVGLTPVPPKTEETREIYASSDVQNPQLEQTL